MGLDSSILPAVKKNLPFIDCDDSLRTVIKKIADSDSSALVVKSNGELVGVLSDMDVMYALVNHKDIDRDKAASVMTACQLITDKPVKSPCVQLYEGETVKNALDVMSAAGVHNLLVSCESGKRTCMVSIRDLLKLVIA